MIISIVKDHFYRICGVLLIGVALIIIVWGELFNSTPEKGQLIKSDGVVESYKEQSSGVKFNLVNEPSSYLYLNKYGNTKQLTTLLSSSDKVNVSIYSSPKDGIENVLALIVNGEPLLTYEASEQLFLQWKKDMRYLALVIALIGIVGALFGDKLARLDKSLG